MVNILTKVDSGGKTKVIMDLKPFSYLYTNKKTVTNSKTQISRPDSRILDFFIEYIFFNFKGRKDVPDFWFTVSLKLG